MPAQASASAERRTLRVALIVAHPDDETLWAGGTVLAHPTWEWTVAALCRGSDPDRSVRFHQALVRLRATGKMADLDDAPEQSPLAESLVRETVLSLLPAGRFDLVLTHGPLGEYTRHRRHEETARAVLALWQAEKISTGELRMFAYDDQGRDRLPRAIRSAHRFVVLPERIWREKRSILTDVYGFAPDSFEVRTTPREEAFWCFDSPASAEEWLKGKVMRE